MDRCANSEALNLYMKGIEDSEKAEERFMEYISSELVELQEVIDRIHSARRSFESETGYNLLELTQDLIDDCK